MSNICRNFARTVYKTHQNRLYSSLGYKSAISLENLYPNSSLKITTPPKPVDESQDKFTGYIPLDQLDITYSRSSGPGGQNVNKVNTKVEVRFKLNSAPWLSDDVKNKLSEKFKNKVSKEGFVIFRSDLTRSQQLNLADCLEKIRTVVRACLVEESGPSEETLERMRRRFEKATRERLAIKREKSQLKSERQSPLVE